MPMRRNGFIVEDLTGVILAGGRSRRFGSDKAFATYKGESFILRTLKLMKGIFREVVIVTNSPEKYREMRAKVIKDEILFQGPAGGIATALRSLKTGGIFVVACDMPFLSKAAILHLLEKDDGSSFVFYEQERGIEPLCAVYRSPLLPLLESRLQCGKADLRSLAHELSVKVRKIPLDKSLQASLRNVNTPKDFELNRILSEIVDLVPGK